MNLKTVEFIKLICGLAIMIIVGFALYPIPDYPVYQEIEEG